MFKNLSLLLFLTMITGCQSVIRPADSDSSLVGLRCVMTSGKKPFERDNLRYVESNADDGNATCKAVLGKMYQEGGYGVDQDFSKARALFVESAKLNPTSNVLLGQMAERGEGEPVDYVKARKLYRLSGENAALPLGRLMEEGKGGPKDVPGAFALYLESSKYCGDDAWNAMDGLRKQGQPLSEVQANRYRQLWVASFLKLQMRRLAVREVFEAVNAKGEAQNVTLSYRFKANSGAPLITMIKGSGDANVDSWVMKAASRITMGDHAPLTDSSGKYEITAPLTFSPRNTQDLQWM